MIVILIGFHSSNFERYFKFRMAFYVIRVKIKVQMRFTLYSYAE